MGQCEFGECDYCTERATFQCADCEDFFLCEEHDDAGPYCDSCKDSHE